MKTSTEVTIRDKAHMLRDLLLEDGIDIPFNDCVELIVADEITRMYASKRRSAIHPSAYEGIDTST